MARAEGRVRVNNNTQSLLKPFSIYRVPQHVRDSVEKKHYEPKLVAIGPYHRGQDHLRAMEERKQLSLEEFLSASAPLATYEDYRGKIRGMERMARARYFESPQMTPDKFVEMLVLDGCFILQFFIKWYGGRSQPHDPILDVAWMLPLLHNDLLMLDNQIPYDVLLALYDIYCRDPGRPTKVWPKKPLMCIIAEYFSEKQSLSLPESTSASQPPQEDGIAHLLHLYHCHFITPPTAEGAGAGSAGEVALALSTQEEEGAQVQAEDEGDEDAPQPPSSVLCATELKLHGVTFRARKNASKKKKSATNIHILDVTFSGGIFQIPPFSIEEPDCSRYMNLVAFEMSHRDVQKKLTSYVMLMDYLIDTPDDVLILQRAKILKSQMSHPQEVADFFNQLRHCSYIDYLRPLYVDVQEYCNRKCPRYMAMLRRDYLSSPGQSSLFPSAYCSPASPYSVPSSPYCRHFFIFPNNGSIV